MTRSALAAAAELLKPIRSLAAANRHPRDVKVDSPMHGSGEANCCDFLNLDALQWQCILSCCLYMPFSLVACHGMQALDLDRSPDLVCHNIVCEKVGEPCICRLSRVLESVHNLQWLSLSGNNLPSLPDSLCNLSELQYLDVHQNCLSTLPDNIAGLQSLRHIDIKDNKVSCLPQGILDLHNLESFHMDGNSALHQDPTFQELQARLRTMSSCSHGV